MPGLFYELSEWWASPYINHFLQPDTIIPDLSNPQSWNRYSYVQNSPINFNDPTGHRACADEYGSNCSDRKGNPTINRKSGCGGPGQKGCPDKNNKKDHVKLPIYGDGLIGPPVPPYGAYSTFFQMLQVFDPYYYGVSAEESYTDFTGGGTMPPVGDALGLFNDFLLGYRPHYLNEHTPYDQSVFLRYDTTYQNIPRIDATSNVTLTGMEIRNGSTFIDKVINYTVAITSVDHSQAVRRQVSAAPGQTVNVPLPGGMSINNGTAGYNISVMAFTGCTGACISNPNNTLVFRGSTTFNFNP